MQKIRILYVEDSRQDLLLLERTLKQAELDFELEHILQLEALERALLASDWDILLTDYHLGAFNADEVLRMVTAMKPALPVVIVSGAVREEDAVDLMRLGAKDFVRKDNSARLVPAIFRELRESEQRKARLSAELALEASQEFTSRILQSTEDCIYILNLSGIVESVTLGSTSSKLSFPEGVGAVGLSFVDLWSIRNDKEDAEKALAKARNGQVGKFIGLQKDAGSSTWWNVIATPIFESHSKPERLLIVARDVSVERTATLEIQKQAIELKEALALAESANQMKTAFLANMSHEIRTPIGAMMGFSELFADPSVAEEDRAEFLEVIKRNGETVLRLLNEILDLSKIEAGHLEIENLEVSLKTLIGDVSANSRLKAEAKGLQLIVNFASPIEEPIKTDPTRLKQIISNILDNAIKFTQKGFVSLTIHLHQDSDHALLSFLVKDTGAGIRLEDQSKLFKTFSQGDNSLTRKFGGTGLGLALSRRLAQALGGDVVIQSSCLGEGSEFLASIKVENLNFANPPTDFARDLGSFIDLPKLKGPLSGASLNGPNLGGMKILVAEDSKDNQQLLQRMLANYGAVVELVSNGEEAVERALANRYEAVLMDLQMPVMDGLAATKKLRSLNYELPIVALTAHAMKENKDECLKQGFDAYFSKPVDFSELVTVLRGIYM